jgi:23S rRNA (pseudouridine1915-N3)-methyltransferase
MQLIIAAVGHKMPAWIETGFGEYAKRMPPECRIQLKEIKPVERSGSKTAISAMALERTRIEAAIPNGSRIIALDECGKYINTMQLSQYLLQWQQNGSDVTFVIGGADGLDAEFKKQADMQIRISSLTLPHGIVRVLLAEQLYRAWSITQNHPYHRASVQETAFKAPRKGTTFRA